MKRSVIPAWGQAEEMNGNDPLPKVEYGRPHPLPTDFLSRHFDAGIPLRFIPAYGGLPLAVVKDLLNMAR